ncbi:hypothetical protein FIBSPDRAFT_464816 [Athelia psychrophila]|uniref:Uncharacterized protein n=1 Tax=Athelia psychrophila TaxID=1759441 RepID=A0A167U5S2_9AGAM|nr:hypothetical protein FIBSPDRAFT_464816 [Fibularhizoctonia sp. CBS 109695]
MANSRCRRWGSCENLIARIVPRPFSKISWTPPRRAHVYLSPPLLHTHPPLKSQSIWCTSDRRASIAGHRQLYTDLVVCIPAPAQHTASAPCHANVPLPPSAHRSLAPPVVRFCLHARVYLPFGVDWIYTRGEELKKGLSRTGDRSEDVSSQGTPACTSTRTCFAVANDRRS